MPKFLYRAVDDYGNYSKGWLEANSFQQAMEQLRGRGLWILDLFDQKNSLLNKEIHFGGSKVKNEHIAIFCRQLTSLYKAGINLAEAVRILGEQTESKLLKKILLDMTDEMEGGKQFSTAAAKYPTVFTRVFINMVRAGEASGNLDEMLDRLAVHYEKEYYTREKVKSALVYPSIISIVTVIVVAILMIFVVPRFAANFRTMGMELPLPTLIVIAISDWVKQYWYLALAVIAAPAMIMHAMKKSAKGRYILDYFKLKIPVFGKLWHKQALARFSRTFCFLFSAAVPLLQLVSIVSSVVGNEVMAERIRESREALRSGNPMAEPLRNSWLFPPMVVQMLAVGERSGDIDNMLEKVADFYESDVDAMAERLKAMLEPMMILILSGIVGLIVLAVMLPSFTLLNGLH